MTPDEISARMAVVTPVAPVANDMIFWKKFASEL